MEKEGLIRAVDFIEHQGLDIGVLVTDRHRQIAKWVRKNVFHRPPLRYLASCKRYNNSIHKFASIKINVTSSVY